MTRDSRMKILVIVAMLLIICGCNSYECTDNKNSLPLAGFYSSEVVPEAIEIDSISIWGIDAPADSILLDSASNVQSVYLPFRIDEDVTKYVIHYNSKALSDSRYNDTIEFKYEIRPYFVSAECGAIYKYKMEEITHTNHLIDSVKCPTGEIDNIEFENIKIYFRVSK